MITDFLKTQRSKEELKAALDVLREFKTCESTDEYLAIPFVAWAKLEQLEEFLAHLAEGTPLAEDTVAYMERANVKWVAYSPLILPVRQISWAGWRR